MTEQTLIKTVNISMLEKNLKNQKTELDKLYNRENLDVKMLVDKHFEIENTEKEISKIKNINLILKRMEKVV